MESKPSLHGKRTVIARLDRAISCYEGDCPYEACNDDLFIGSHLPDPPSLIRSRIIKSENLLLL